MALLILQPLAIATVLVTAAELINGSRWIVLLPVIALVLAVWVGQAVHAHRRALALGAAPGGELQIAWLLPLVVAVVTGFWLLGGQHASVAATLGEYVTAWQSGSASTAAGLFAAPVAPTDLSAAWQAQRDYVQGRISAAAALYGQGSGLDAETPFTGLRFSQVEPASSSDVAVVSIEIVRRQRVETTLFGIIPTASQQTMLVERAGTIEFRAQPASGPGWLPALSLAGQVWLIERVELP